MGGGSKTLEHHDILRTLSEVATAFAGFTGIIVVLGSRARDRGEPYFGSRSIIPRVYGFGLFIVLAQFLTAAGFLSSWLFFFYLLGLLWLLLMATYVFSVLLLESVSSRPDA